MLDCFGDLSLDPLELQIGSGDEIAEFPVLFRSAFQGLPAGYLCIALGLELAHGLSDEGFDRWHAALLSELDDSLRDCELILGRRGGRPRAGLGTLWSGLTEHGGWSALSVRSASVSAGHYLGRAATRQAGGGSCSE
eukprot:15447060-Alexandrium_andersonii.AAC.1